MFKAVEKGGQTYALPINLLDLCLPSQIYCYDGLEIIHDYTLEFLIRS